MTLAEYLREHRISASAFARTLGVDGSTVSRWQTGARVPEPAQMVLIVEATEGRVTPNDFMLPADVAARLAALPAPAVAA